MPHAEINGTRLYYEEWGDGPPVVLTHGLGGDSSMWVYQIPAFSQLFKVIAWDVRGHGRSEDVTTGYTLEQFTADLGGIMNLLGVHHAHLVGLSMGGLLSWNFAAENPDRVWSLTLSDSAGPLTGLPEAERERKRQMFGLSADVAEKEGRAALTDATLDLMFSRRFIESGSPVLEAVRERIASDRGLGFARAVKGVFMDFWSRPEEEVIAKLKTIRAPTLVIAGDEDKLTPLPAQEAIHRAIPDSRMHVITGAGHVPPIEKPEEWNALVLDFLKGFRERRRTRPAG